MMTDLNVLHRIFEIDDPTPVQHIIRDRHIIEGSIRTLQPSNILFVVDENASIMKAGMFIAHVVTKMGYSYSFEYYNNHAQGIVATDFGQIKIDIKRQRHQHLYTTNACVCVNYTLLHKRGASSG